MVAIPAEAVTMSLGENSLLVYSMLQAAHRNLWKLCLGYLDTDQLEKSKWRKG